MPVSHSHILKFEAEVVDVNTPLLLNLETLTQVRALLDFGDDRLVGKYDGWVVPLVRMRGHVNVEWPVSVFFLWDEFCRMHRHFKHPAPDRFHAIIKRAEPLHEHCHSPRNLEDVTKRCEVCQREHSPPYRFRLQIPMGDEVFNEVVCLNLMKINGRSVIHAVDHAANFRLAKFLNRENVEELWRTFEQMWSLTYVSPPNATACDQCSVFISISWETLIRAYSIRCQLSGIEAHNALRKGEN